MRAFFDAWLGCCGLQSKVRATQCLWANDKRDVVSKMLGVRTARDPEAQSLPHPRTRESKHVEQNGTRVSSFAGKGPLPKAVQRPRRLHSEL
jgi:hypothetical protein